MDTSKRPPKTKKLGSMLSGATGKKPKDKIEYNAPGEVKYHPRRREDRVIPYAWIRPFDKEDKDAKTKFFASQRAIDCLWWIEEKILTGGMSWVNKDPPQTKPKEWPVFAYWCLSNAKNPRKFVRASQADLIKLKWPSSEVITSATDERAKSIKAHVDEPLTYGHFHIMPVIEMDGGKVRPATDPRVVETRARGRMHAKKPKGSSSAHAPASSSSSATRDSDTQSTHLKDVRPPAPSHQGRVLEPLVVAKGETVTLSDMWWASTERLPYPDLITLKHLNDVVLDTVNWDRDMFGPVDQLTIKPPNKPNQRLLDYIGLPDNVTMPKMFVVFHRADTLATKMPEMPEMQEMPEALQENQSNLANGIASKSASKSPSKSPSKKASKPKTKTKPPSLAPETLLQMSMESQSEEDDMNVEETPDDEEDTTYRSPSPTKIAQEEERRITAGPPKRRKKTSSKYRMVLYDGDGKPVFEEGSIERFDLVAIRKGIH